MILRATFHVVSSLLSVLKNSDFDADFDACTSIENELKTKIQLILKVSL